MVQIQLLTAIEKYYITADNIFNFDKKGFLIGFGNTLKRIITKEAYDSGRVTKSRQDGNREFITLLDCISAIRKSIPPVLIYAGKSGDLQTTWMEEVNKESGVYFDVSTNGWSNDEIRLSWLQQIFERYTKPTRANTKRLLI